MHEGTLSSGEGILSQVRRERSTSFLGRQMCKGPEVRESLGVFKGAGLSRMEIRGWQGGLSPQVDLSCHVRICRCSQGWQKSFEGMPESG